MSVTNVTIDNIPLVETAQSLDLQAVNIIDLTESEMATLSQLVAGLKATIGPTWNTATPAGAMRWLLQQVKTAAGE